MVIFALAPIAGILLGALDFLWIKFVPAPFGDLGNSLAVWAVAAYFFSSRTRRPVLPARPLATAAGAALFLVVAVPAYYLTATLVQHDAASNAWSSFALLWMALGVVAGAVFGLAATSARNPGPLRLPSAAFPAAVLFAEAAIGLRRLGNPDYELSDLRAFAALLIVLGLATTLATTRTWRDRALTLLWSIPLTALGWLALTLTGFH